MKASRARSFDKDRKPIFRKNSREEEDFGSLVLGLEDVKNSRKSSKKLEIAIPMPCREINQERSSLSIESKSTPKSESRQSKQEQKKAEVKRNPVLDSSASIHRWLTENNKPSEFSCFNEIIKEEDIEESLFY